MSTNVFKGYLGRRMQEHIEMRRSLGRCYVANEQMLLRFNRFIERRWPSAKTITQEMVMVFLRSNRHMKISSRKNEITYIRMFCIDLSANGKPVYLPKRNILPKLVQATRVHVFSETEILRVMRAAEGLGSPVHRTNYTTLVGLFWTTGLRMKEALSVDVDDINWVERILFVRKGKFGKTRYVPLSKSTTTALAKHVERMRLLGVGGMDKSPLFVDCKGRRMSQYMAGYFLPRLYRKADIKTNWGGYPRTHDLRHSFATHSLTAIREQGSDPSNSVPALAIVMGHADISSTQAYLHPNIDTLQVVSKSFEKKHLNFRGVI